MSELQLWLDKVKGAENATDVFGILNEFRPGDWTDDERSMMSRTYMAVLGKLGLTGPALVQEANAKAAEVTPQPLEVEADDRNVALDPEEMLDAGPVWYEKM
jgi:hypothetical protein